MGIPTTSIRSSTMASGRGRTRRTESMIRPLPYDVRELRRLYPGSNPRTAVSVLNTWFVRDDSGAACAPNLQKDPEAAALCDADPPPSTVTSQKMLCEPSVGSSSLDSKKFTAWCGTSNDTSVCPGDVIQVHYALANYSTTSVTVDSNMWLSVDDVWDQGDQLSPTTKTYGVAAAEAQNKFWGYEVPSLPLWYWHLLRHHARDRHHLVRSHRQELDSDARDGDRWLGVLDRNTG